MANGTFVPSPPAPHYCRGLRDDRTPEQRGPPAVWRTREPNRRRLSQGGHREHPAAARDERVQDDRRGESDGRDQDRLLAIGLPGGVPPRGASEGRLGEL